MTPVTREDVDGRDGDRNGMGMGIGMGMGMRRVNHLDGETHSNMPRRPQGLLGLVGGGETKIGGISRGSMPN